MSADDIARFVTVGLVLLRDGAPSWRNPAADAMVARHGASWVGPQSPLDLLATVAPGARRVPVVWSPPAGGVRRWRLSCTRLEGAQPGLLYELLDDTVDAVPGPAEAEAELARMHAMAGVGSWTWDVHADAVEWSPEFLRHFGLEPDTRLTFEAWQRVVHPEDRAATMAEVTAALRELRPFTFTHRALLGERHEERVVECHGEVLPDASGAAAWAFGTVRDITVQHRAQQELAYLSTHDPLTGIANRQQFTDRLAELGLGPGGACLLVIDIDNFKDINDLRGHVVGDRVIRHVAATLAAELGRDGELGRLGGDEFAVVVPVGDAEVAMTVATRLAAAVAARPVPDGTGTLRVTISLGVAIALDDDVEAGLAQADLALRAAKCAGRNRARLFTDDQYTRAVRRVSLLRRVRAALDNDLMRLHAQPIVELATGRTSRYELLIRLRDGDDPPLGPDDFLPAVERTDLVLRLDRWVLERAIRALAAPRSRERGLRLEVNLSARSLEDPDLGRWIRDRLDAAGVPPHRLGLEITETAAIHSLTAARTLATQLREAGCGFALDDFGSGFGSFSYLKHLPFTAVKIAGEFVRQLDRDEVDRALVTAVVGMARQLGIRTVAEQVDRAQLVTQLRAAGVDDGQGYHLGRPRPLDP